MPAGEWATDRQPAGTPDLARPGATTRNHPMAKTYDQIQSQIHKLQREADALKAKEIAGVVARMQ